MGSDVVITSGCFVAKLYSSAIVVFLTELAKKALSMKALHGDFGMLCLDAIITS
jgi:hypothetical protein